MQTSEAPESIFLLQSAIMYNKRVLNVSLSFWYSLIFAEFTGCGVLPQMISQLCNCLENLLREIMFCHLYEETKWREQDVYDKPDWNFQKKFSLQIRIEWEIKHYRLPIFYIPSFFDTHSSCKTVKINS